MQTIARVLTHHGFGHLVAKMNLERFVPLPKRWRASLPSDAAHPESTIGRRLTQVCEDLGPTFIKLGQMLSTRPDIIPGEIVKELTRLQDDVPPFDTERAKAIIAADLGAPVEECFETIEDEPFASGSIAQVYRATLKKTDQRGTRSAVVKVKRPDIEDTVKLDMIILKWFAELAERMLPELSALQPLVIVEEFENNIFKEMDFINEAATIGRFAELYGSDANFDTPAVYWEFTGPRVITLQEITGTSLQHYLFEDMGELDRPLMARKILRAFIRQYFEMGLFHADPHPGNLLVRPPAHVGLIDFGLTGRLDETMTGQLVLGLTGAISKQPEIIVEVLADMDALGEETDRRQLRRELLLVTEKYYGLPLHRFDMQTLYFEVTGILRRNYVTLPREFVLFGKSLMGIGGLCLQLDPKMDLVAELKPKLNKLILEQLSPRKLAKYASISGWHMLNIFKSAPGLLRDVSRQLARGKWQVNIRHQNLDYLANEIDRASNRLGFSVIIGAIIVGSSWVISTPNDLELFGLPLWFYGITGYIVAGILGLWLVIAILRSGKLS